MALNPSGAISLGGPTSGQSIAVELGLSPTASISLNQTDVRTLAGVPSGAIVMPTDFWGKSNVTGTQKAIFAFGTVLASPFYTGVTNLVSSAGVVASDTPAVFGTPRQNSTGASYGGDKAIVGFGRLPPAGTITATTHLVSNAGVVASSTPGAPGVTARQFLAAAGYGGDKAIFGFGTAAPPLGISNITNLVSNTGVVAANTPGAPGVSARNNLAAAGYGGDKAIFAFSTGFTPPAPATITNAKNLVSNTGVVAADAPGVGTARNQLAAASYGGDKAIFGFGRLPSPFAATSITNLVSNTGVVASDTPGVGTARANLAAAGYGGDKAIFGFGFLPPPAAPPAIYTAVTNLVSNAGVVASDTPGVGTARSSLAAAGFSLTP
jgi:hypothetical protein